MKHFVARTCTVVGKPASAPPRETESTLPSEADSHPLEAFRDKPAYVLLGPPGAGKTEAFRHEARSEGIEPVTARDFWKLQARPEWRGKTIYIDGLDEVRAGSADGRTPFDEIRARLQELGCPRFRLSCREADWFGANDREHLSAVAPNGEVQVLRLDPLSDQGVLKILERNHGVDHPAAFVAKAQERGVEDLLRNPQNLRMLAEAVVEADEWPRTRAETFDMACRKLVSEENREHQIACSGTFNTKALMDGAGDLCALLLLAGKAGVTLPGTNPDASHPRLDQVPSGNQQLLRRVVGANLFTMPSEGRLAPTHRQIAEFLAARRLADLIADGLPAGRVLSLMTGFDGGIISEFRGLAAWLAVQSATARAEIIERDPMGVVLYGEIQQFGPHEKRLLFQALKGAVDQNPWLVSYTSSDSPLRSLVGPDLEDELRQALTDTARDDAHQSIVLLITEAIRDAAPHRELADPLMTIVRDNSWRPTIRCAALEAYIPARDNDPRLSVTLRELLDEVYTGSVATQDDDLLGTLLAKLYPDDLPLVDLVSYLREPARRNLWTRYCRFWTDDLIEKSTVRQMVRLLDLLRVPMERVRAESGTSPNDLRLVVRPPIVLFRHLLERSPQSVSQEQIIYWLDFAAWVVLNIGSGADDAEFFRNWLSGRPDIYRAIVENGVTKCREEGDFRPCMRRVKQTLLVLRPSPPQDYGVWCADEALGSANDNVARWFVRESAEFVFYQKEPGQRQWRAVARKLRDDVRLGRLFEGRLGDLEAGLSKGERETPKARLARKNTRFDELREVFKKNESALRANECPASLLHTLAVAYFDGYSNVSGKTPKGRLRYLLGPDDDLLEAAMSGLRGAVHRLDLPEWTEVSRLAAEGRTHYLAYPFMVGVEELAEATETSDCHLSDSQARLAVAIHFAVPRMRQRDHSKRPPGWLRGCLARDPDTVAEVWSRCARAQLDRGERYLPDSDRLAREREYSELARAASVPLLKAFPVRCRSEQLPILRSLLGAAIAHGDRTQLLGLIDSKLAYTSMNSGQRVYWLTAGLLAQPKEFGDRLESYVSGNVRRIERLVEMACAPAVAHALRDRTGVTVLEKLIRLIGPYSIEPPNTGEVYSVTWPIHADRTLRSFIDRLAEDTSDMATDALESLAKDDRLVNRRPELLDRLHRHRGIRREATFAHPSLEQVAEVLDRGRPANAADLWALTTDVLRRVGKDLRGGSPSGWRSFWHVDQYDRVTSPLPENACRRPLVLALRPLLAAMGIDTQIGGRYADDKRADIRVACHVFNVPIEIKKSCHRDLWSAIHTQLIAKYTRDPDADGYGIYLVFWFGEAEDCQPTPRSGPKPKSAAELQTALHDTLSDLERRKISVLVIDASQSAV